MAEIERDGALRRRPHDDLLVEAPQILEGAAAARDDEHVRAGMRPARFEGIEAADRGGHLLGRGLALHARRPDQHAAREAVAEPVQDVADDGTGRRGDDADDARQIGQRFLALEREQALGGELLPRSSSSAMSAPIPAGSSVSMTIWYLDWPGKVVMRPVATTSRPSAA